MVEVQCQCIGAHVADGGHISTNLNSRRPILKAIFSYVFFFSFQNVGRFTGVHFSHSVNFGFVAADGLWLRVLDK